LDKAGVEILGTPPAMIDNAEDRMKFSDMIDEMEFNSHVGENSQALRALWSLQPMLACPGVVNVSHASSPS
jgi:carbamoylphosphate synthase large subunit